jgi:hypothetical protein
MRTLAVRVGTGAALAMLVEPLPPQAVSRARMLRPAGRARGFREWEVKRMQASIVGGRSEAP